jgi:N-glycosylase/DNA lyase
MGWRSLQAQEFDLGLTMASGQFFRYSTHNGTVTLLTQEQKITVRQEGDTLLFTGCSAEFLINLFSLHDAYEKQLSRLSQDPVLVPIIEEYHGLRILRQELHETILGFLCSSASNIPKIRLNLELLAERCGTIKDGTYSLPQPGTQLDLAMVRSCKTGYRAEYIVATNARLTPAFLRILRSADYETAHTLLCTLPGVGPKVADCICLFGLGHGEAFPVDVHVLRAMRALFPRSRLTTTQRAKRFALRRWGKDAGLAQQFLYQHARDKLRLRVVA